MNTEENQPVLSQETETTVESTQVKSESKGNPEMARRRLAMKPWRQELAEETKKATDEASKRAATEEGFEDSEENAKQRSFISKTLNYTREAEGKARVGILTKHSSDALTETFKSLEIDPTSDEARLVGNHMFRKFGVEDPERFADSKLVEQEMENLTSRLTRKKVDPIKEEAIRKAGAPKGSSESRTESTVAAKKGEDKDIAKRMGISPERVEKIKKLQERENLPPYLR